MMQGFVIALILGCIASERVLALTIVAIVLWTLYRIFAALDQQ